jgi:hypothetical protein
MTSAGLSAFGAIHLSNTEIRRPRVGSIVTPQRIDGYCPEGRLDFRR